MLRSFRLVKELLTEFGVAASACYIDRFRSHARLVAMLQTIDREPMR